MAGKIPSYTDIKKAHELIMPLIHRTPVLTSKTLNEITGGSLFFKCENFQKAGAFKYRGATHAVLNVSDHDAGKGVATHSSGNHAAALALAAKNQNIPAYIVMPENAPEIKKKAVAGYGATIIYCQPTLKAREETLDEVVKETGATFIHPYNHFNVICGQGTAAKELIEETGGLDILIVPVGGGGLLSGSAIAAKHLLKKIQVIAAEPSGADDACQSFRAGKIIPSINPVTIADGLLTSLGTLTFAIIQEYVDSIVAASDTSIINAMRMVWERMKIIIEPSSAVTLAIILENKIDVTGKRVGIILSGGNVELSKLPFL